MQADVTLRNGTHCHVILWYFENCSIMCTSPFVDGDALPPGFPFADLVIDLLMRLGIRRLQHCGYYSEVIPLYQNIFAGCALAIART